MGQQNDDLAEVAPSGTVAPVGGRAALRLQAHAGMFHVAPAPREVLFLRRRATSEEPVRPCALAGQVRGAGALCDVLSFVGHAGWRGELVVRDGATGRAIFFDQGHVVGAQSDVVRERLGEVLFRYGILTREQVERCGDASADGSLRFGEAAVKLGLLAREKLFELMARQTEEIFYGLLLVADGMFYFLDGFDDAQLSSRHRLSVSALLRDGIRRMHEMRYFRARVPSEAHIPVRVAGRSPADPDPLGVYAAIDGRRDVAAICREVGAPEFEVTRALFQLAQSGDVYLRPARLEPKAAVEVYNRAIALILRELDAMDEGDAVREQLAKFAAQKATYTELFGGAGPADDGTLDAARIAENVARAGRGDEGVDALTACLHEYASYALFLARPHVRRREERREPDGKRLSQRVSQMLEPIAPETPRKPGAGKR